jgi:hypothetical protein
MQRSLLGRFQSWLHAGEEGAVAVYPTQGIRKILLLQCGGIAIFLYLFPDTARFLIPIASVGFLCTLAEDRRAIIFTEREVIYRPPLGQPRHLLIPMIQSLKRSVVLVAYLVRATRRPGVTITLSNGAEEVWPLAIESRDEVLQRLSALTGKTIEE